MKVTTKTIMESVAAFMQADVLL